MIIISEYKVEPEQLEKYEENNIRFAYGYEDYTIHKGEAVGILLDTMYKSTIDLIERLLWSKHAVTIKYDNKTYTLHSLDEWKYTHQSEKDALKLKTDKHPIYQIYLDKKAEYNRQRYAKTKKNQLQFVSDYKDAEDLDQILNAFAYLYDINVDYEDTYSKLSAYQQIKWYLDNNIDYINPAPVIPYDETPMFNMFQVPSTSDVEEIVLVYYGNEEYFEDTHYKITENTCELQQYVI